MRETGNKLKNGLQENAFYINEAYKVLVVEFVCCYNVTAARHTNTV